MIKIEEMIAVVQMYTRHRKDKEVQIKIRNVNDIAKLTMAYNIVSNWLGENNFKCKLI